MNDTSVLYIIGIILAMSICIAFKIVMTKYYTLTFNIDVKNREIWKYLYKNQFRIKDKNILHATVIRNTVSEISYRVFLSSVIDSLMIVLLLSFKIITNLEQDVTYDLLKSVWVTKYYAPLLLYALFGPLISVILMLSFIYTII